MDPLEAEIVCTMGGNKHLQPKTTGSSTSGIMQRGKFCHHYLFHNVYIVTH